MTARFALIALMATLAGGAATAAPAELAMTWNYSPGHSPQDDATLAFGAEGTDMVAAILRCQPRSGRITISTFAGAARQGETVRLRSGAAVSQHRAHVEPNEAGEGDLLYFVQTTTAVRDPALRTFRRGAPLSILAGRARTDTPAAPRALTARFFRSCGG
jgi:hypothetical protein